MSIGHGLIGGFIADAIGSVVTLALAITGLVTGIARYRQVLVLRGSRLAAAKKAELIEAATATGFFLGVIVSAAIVLFDALVGA